MNPQDKPESESTKWGDLAEDDEVDSGASEDNLSKEVEEKLSTKVAPGNEDVDEPLPISVTKGQLLPNQEEDKLIVDQSDPTSPLYSVHSFEELGLAPELLRGVYALGYNKPSRIQEAALPIALGNPPQNLIAQAQSGTGKTAAFTLSMLSRSTPDPYPQALCVCPTRELARQIHSVVSEMGKFSEIKPLLVVRDAPIPKTKITHQIVIGTPGKLLDLLKHRTLDTSRIKVFVLDEADEMLALQGLSPQTLRLKNALPGKGKNCQILLFSATYDDKVAKFAYQVVPKPHVSIRLERKQLSLDKIAQFYIDCGSEGNKFNVLAELYCYLSVGQSIIFVARRSTAQEITQRMRAMKHTVSLLHGGDMESNERDAVIDDFRSGKTKVLITTNVLARGIDILQVSLVINYDLPLDRENRPDFSTYLHRIGRSGRFGRSGIAINFVHDNASKKDLQAIEAYFQRKIEPFPEEDMAKLTDMLREIQ